MKNVFYVTSFNDPASCADLMEDFSGVDILGYERILMDQSDDDHAPLYDPLCEKYGYKHLRFENRGAMVTKHNVIRHAYENGYEFMAQISEDFKLCEEGENASTVVTGRSHFFKVAHDILIEEPRLSFVNWTLYRVNGLGYHWGSWNPMWRLRNMSRKLMHIEGDICLFNWPYTGRVSAVRELLRQSDILGAGSEANMAKVSLGHGACLLAHPVRHTNRIKPRGSIA